MKHWKKLLVCLLAGVLALGAADCLQRAGGVNAGTDAEKVAELAQQLGVAQEPELDNGQSGGRMVCTGTGQPARVSGLDLVYTVALDADGNMGYTNNLNAFHTGPGAGPIPDDVTVALLLDDSAAMTACCMRRRPTARRQSCWMTQSVTAKWARPSSTTTAPPMSWQCSGKQAIKGRSVERPFF